MEFDTFTETKGLKQIGKGMFSKVYGETDSTVLINSSDPIKECNALWGLADSDLFPEIERIEYGCDSSLYRMKRYNKVRAPKKELLPDQYRIYTELRKLMRMSYENNYQFADCVNSLDLDEDTKESIICAFESCMNYTDKVGFEISPRNIAVDEGKLILLDCFFDRKRVIQAWSKKAPGYAYKRWV